MKHVMIDLETLGTSADSVFLSVAALQFDIEGKIGASYVANVTLESAINAGRKISASTLEWWLTQKPEILKLMFVNPKPLADVLTGLELFIKRTGVLYPWGNSASFDLGMLANAYTNERISLPWKYANERCYRSTWELLSKCGHSPKHANAHDPLVDCTYQVHELSLLNLR